MPPLKRFVIHTPGATAPELISSALATHPRLAVLPGLAFIRDELRLYRPHRLADSTAHELFDRLWAPSYEPSGRMWAGIARRMSSEELPEIDLRAARQAFSKVWSPRMSYIDTLFSFAESIAPAIGAWKAGASHLGFCGPPLLLTLDWNELAAREVRVLTAETSLPIWLALISFRSIVNCLDALQYWIIHRLIIAYARHHGVDTAPVDSVAAGRSPLGAWRALELDDTRATPSDPGPGHTRFDAVQFAANRALADSLAALYAGDALYDAADHADEWVDLVVAAPDIRRLLNLYIEYWRSSAHIHFDTSGPLERQIATRALEIAGLAAPPDSRSFEQRFGQRFFHHHIRFRSYSFEHASTDVDTYLGSLENLLVLPRAPYFVHAALLYLERCLDSQSKWCDSYQPLAQSPLYGKLRDPALARILQTNGLGLRLEHLEQRDAEIALSARGRAYPRG
jgi:hypothetical protein